MWVVWRALHEFKQSGNNSHDFRSTEKEGEPPLLVVVLRTLIIYFIIIIAIG